MRAPANKLNRPSSRKTEPTTTRMDDPLKMTIWNKAMKISMIPIEIFIRAAYKPRSRTSLERRERKLNTTDDREDRIITMPKIHCKALIK